ncbi:MAG: CvpA family protein [Pseudomonadota bacterium]
MEQFTIVDGGVAAIAVISGMLAYARGFTRELFAIAGWIIAAGVAFYAAPFVEPLIREAPVIGQFLASSCVISMIAAFTLVVAVTLLVMSVFTPLASNMILESALAPVDRALGFLFGVARGLALVAVGYLLYVNLSGGAEWEPLQNAASRQIFDELAVLVEQNLPTQVPDWFGQRIDALMAPCGAEIAPSSGSGNTDGGSGTAPAPAIQPAPGTNS